MILNDPFAGGTHLNDITLVAPVFAVDGDGLVGWAANRAHHADVGGVGARARSRPTRPRSSRRACASRPCGSPTSVRGLLLAASRTPDERRGDLDAQVGANVVGVERLAGVGRRAARTRWSPTASGACGPRSPTLPDGTWRSTTSLDSPGPRPISSTRRHVG